MASIGCLSLVITAGLEGRSLDGVLEGNDSRSVPVDGSLADGAMLDV
jgi:hypothetical protein